MKSDAPSFHRRSYRLLPTFLEPFDFYKANITESCNSRLFEPLPSSPEYLKIEVLARSSLAVSELYS